MNPFCVSRLTETHFTRSDLYKRQSSSLLYCVICHQNKKKTYWQASDLLRVDPDEDYSTAENKIK